MPIYAAFGIGVGNLGHGAPRRPMARWVEMLNAELSHGYPSVRVIGSFGHTGNFLADSLSTDLQEVTDRFGRALDTDWVVRPIDDVRAALTALARVAEPRYEMGIRWTSGVAFHGGRGIEFGSVARTAGAIIWKVSPQIIGVWKRDHLDTNGTLDRGRRGGGWGKISQDIETQLGGRWTARSRRTVEGLVKKTGEKQAAR